jgi:hypothetical protein
MDDIVIKLLLRHAKKPLDFDIVFETLRQENGQVILIDVDFENSQENS